MTRHELRILYLLKKHGGRCRHSQISQAMSRVKIRERDAALARVEEFGLVSSAMTPPAANVGGRGALVYWLTPEGRSTVEHLIETGELKDPATEARR